MRSPADRRGPRSGRQRGGWGGGPGSGREDGGGRRRRPHGDRGAAVVDFALVSGLLTLVFAGVVQLTLAVHVRNTLVDCAAEGARYAALADRSPQDGVARTRALIDASLAAGYSDQVTAVQTQLRGLPVVEVRVTAPLPVVGLLGPGGMVSVTGHALEEEP